eukprot:COSAG01_NODE_29643_length_633_cov_0.870787_1_plen_123_part_01
MAPHKAGEQTLEGVYESFKKRRVGANRHTIVAQGARYVPEHQGVKHVVELKRCKQWRLVGGVLYGRHAAEDITLRALLAQAQLHRWSVEVSRLEAAVAAEDSQAAADAAAAAEGGVVPGMTQA